MDKSDTTYTTSIGDIIVPSRTLDERIIVCKKAIESWNRTTSKAVYTLKLIDMLTEKLKRDYCG